MDAFLNIQASSVNYNKNKIVHSRSDSVNIQVLPFFMKSFFITFFMFTGNIIIEIRANIPLCYEKYQIWKLSWCACLRNFTSAYFENSSKSSVQYLLKTKIHIIFQFSFYLALKGELHEQALRLATELQVGDIIITKLETAQSDKCKVWIQFWIMHSLLTLFIIFKSINLFCKTLKTICTSILAVLGKFDIILDNASKAKNEGKDYNGSFVLFGDNEFE